MADENDQGFSPSVVVLIILISLICCCGCICACCGQWCLGNLSKLFKSMTSSVRECCNMFGMQKVVNKDTTTIENEEEEELASKEVDEATEPPRNEGRQPGSTRHWWDLCGCCGGESGGQAAKIESGPPPDPADPDPKSEKQMALLASLPSATVIRPIRKVAPNIDYALDYGVAIPLLNL